MDQITIASLNLGIQKGKPLQNTYRNQINTEIFLKNGRICNLILCLQEIDINFWGFKNYGNVINDTSSNDGSKKENQLRIIYNDKYIRFIEQVKVKLNTRLQIASFQFGDYYFIIINCHMPQKKCEVSAYDNFFILNQIIGILNSMGIPFFIVGDMNHSTKELYSKFQEHKIFYANIKEKTTDANSIDNILYSSHNYRNDFEVIKNATSSSFNAVINHYAIRSTFNFENGFSLKYGFLQNIYDDCFSELIKYQKNKPQRLNKEIFGIEIRNDILISRVIFEFQQETNKIFNTKQFHEKYFKGFNCSCSALRRFLNGETQKSKCKIVLVNYLNNI
ncbi:hypothetical protein ACTFIU_007077 [Dictyostelium citrinum]